MTNESITLAERLEDIAQDLTFMKDRNTIREAIALLAADMSERIKSAACQQCASHPCICKEIAAPEAPRQSDRWRGSSMSKGTRP